MKAYDAIETVFLTFLPPKIYKPAAIPPRIARIFPSNESCDREPRP